MKLLLPRPLWFLNAALFCALLVSPPPSVSANEPPMSPPTFAVEEQKAAMEKLSMMIGDWKGTGWIMGPRGRSEFHGGERVQAKIGGLALLVEGSFFRRDTATGEDIPTHTTLGVISFDPRTETYRFRSWLATGTSGEHELEVTADGWSWQITTPRGRIRYATRFADGAWHEIGERSTDGEKWQQFFEMRLERTAAAPISE